MKSRWCGMSAQRPRSRSARSGPTADRKPQDWYRSAGGDLHFEIIRAKVNERTVSVSAGHAPRNRRAPIGLAIRTRSVLPEERNEAKKDSSDQNSSIFPFNSENLLAAKTG